MAQTRRVFVVVAALLVSACGARTEPTGAPVRALQQALALPLISPELVFGRAGSVSDDFPDTAWSATQFLVTWLDTRKSGAQTLEGTRVQPDGSELDSPPIRIASATGTPAPYAVGADGSGFLVTGQGASACWPTAASWRRRRRSSRMCSRGPAPRIWRSGMSG